MAYGSANNGFTEGRNVNPGPTANNSAARLGAGAQDTDNNSADFTTLTPSAPRNLASPPLLVELSSFTAALDGTRALLRWTTESETNNAGFTIEQQNGHWNWVEVGTVAGRGTTSERATYSFSVDGLAAGTYRFRLRQTDFDGTTSHSPIVEVTVLEDALGLRVQGRTLVLTTREAQAMRVEAFDVLGRRVALLFDGTLGAGDTRTLALTPVLLAGGLYVLRVTGEAQVFSRTVLLP